MEIDDRGLHVDAEFVPLQQLLDGAERIIERVHEKAAHGLGYQDFAVVGQGDHRRAGAGRAGWEIQRTDQARFAGNEGDDLLAVPGVVAKGDGIGAGGEQCLGHVRGQAEAVRGILGVDRNEIGPDLGA